ncbi:MULTISPECIES: hypothetical protein [Stenotrophomonas]|uniref:hypothetical protein n=1 Tax=Stenotrophomonas TaxID=40323 RepID=UPI00087306EA|nr:MULTISPECIES: hypothetical protein [Stenotrophomonas]OEZ02289.1 hypothetical protein BIY45_01810 [Stenotrophomonas sp. BIIR7]
MDQPASKTPLSAHPAEDIRFQRHIAIILRAQLLNHGLDMPGCEVAYLGAHWATNGNCELAWEAARRHQLQMLGDATDIVPTGRDARSDRSGMSSAELERRRTARQALIHKARALVNPFAVQSRQGDGELLLGNADLERAA